MFAKQLPKEFVALIVFIALFNGLATVFYWYWEIRWLDKPMHVLGGFWLGGTGLWWYYHAHRNALKERMRTATFVMTCAVATAFIVGGLWEIFEYGLDLYVHRHWSAIDTTGDLIADIVGGVLVGFYVRLRGYHRLPEVPQIKNH